jgi:acetoin utilization protein AcuB
VVASENATIDEMNRLMKEHGVRHIPIVRNHSVVGVVSDRDCRVASGLTQDEKRLVRASDIMATDPVTVSAGETLDKVAFAMSTKKIGSVIVNDEDDKLLGIFTVTDALNALIEIARGEKLDRVRSRVKR